ncbi:hypothetical protein KC906_02065, partial [Candidatus Kaiserbacteria bacterium]|nr:hypothetical protein [Candidatus Kaiserbacteria bacterium]
MLNEALSDKPCRQENIFPLTDINSPLLVKLGPASPPMQKLHNFIHSIQSWITPHTSEAILKHYRHCQQCAVKRMTEVVAETIGTQKAAEFCGFELDATWNLYGIRKVPDQPDTKAPDICPRTAQFGDVGAFAH